MVQKSAASSYRGVAPQRHEFGIPERRRGAMMMKYVFLRHRARWQSNRTGSRTEPSSSWCFDGVRSDGGAAECHRHCRGSTVTDLVFSQDRELLALKQATRIHAEALSTDVVE